MPSQPISSRTSISIGTGPPNGDSSTIARTAPRPSLRADGIGSPAAGLQPTLRSIARERDAVVSDLLAHVPAADRAAAKTAIPAIIEAARESGRTDPNQLGYLLATAQTESDFGANMVENGHSKAWFNAAYGHDDGNRPGTDDGYAYRGRGYVQATHAGRYAELSHQLRLPDVPEVRDGRPVLDARGKPQMIPALVADPTQLAKPDLAARALVVGVERNLFTHNASAAFDKTIPAGMKPGAVDFYHARALVNGIIPAQAQAVAGHATTYARVLTEHRSGAPDIAETK